MFWLGAPRSSWLRKPGQPIMLSRHRMAARGNGPATRPWFLDSGAFTKITTGGWDIGPDQWSDEVQELAAWHGWPAHVGIQDWLCIPPALDATGLDVESHQQLTVRSLLDLRSSAPHVPWLPTLQGWTVDDYLANVDQYAASGVDLLTEPIVGIGSIAARQHTDQAEHVIRELHDAGIQLHAFGASRLGLRRWGWAVRSADSASWSMEARNAGRPFCRLDAPHRDCRNCPVWAERWGLDVAKLVDRNRPAQLTFGLTTVADGATVKT